MNHPKHLNTPRQVYDDQQQLRWKWDQAEPFGVTSPDENPANLGAFELPFRFPGQYADRETNLAHNGYRDYDSGIGRYAQGDPIGLDGGINLYAYVGGSPLRFVDFFGLQAVPAPAPTPPIAGPNSGSAANIAKAILNLFNRVVSFCTGSCPPCDPVVGTRCFRHNFGHSHGPFPAKQSHFHLYQMQQIPSPSCKCTWKQQGGTRGTVDFAPYVLLDCEVIPSWIAEHGGT
jgi:RHS repeat-associated protein